MPAITNYVSPAEESMVIEGFRSGLGSARVDLVSPTPDGIITRNTILDIWIGVKDGLPRKYLMRPAEKIFNPQLIERDTFTCSYSDVPEIKAPI